MPATPSFGQGTPVTSRALNTTFSSLLAGDYNFTNIVATGNVQVNTNDYLSPYQGFRNAIINGDFRINQRAFTSTTTSLAFGFDRFQIEYAGGTTTMSAQTFTVGSPAATGFESPNFCRVVPSGQSAASDLSVFHQKIEDVRTFANSTVTVSFWAKAGSGTPKVALEFLQNFGSGGSATVFTYVGQPTLSTSWARFSFTVALPNINDKTIGTSPYLLLALWCSGGSTYNSRINTLGLQSNIFDFWGVQVERGSVATPFERRPIGTELALCQRYFQVIAKGSGKTLGNNVTLTANDTRGSFFLPVAMRTAPSLTVTTGTGYYRYYYDAVFADSSSIGSYAAGTENMIVYSSGAVIASGKSSMLQTNNAAVSITASTEL